MTRIGLFGGSFNPIHHGHLLAARAVAEAMSFERVIFLPSRRPPHKNDHDLLDAEHRTQMVKLAIAGEKRFEFSDHDLTCEGPSYTIDTVAHFRDRLGAGVELFWIIGADSLAELPTWHRARELADTCRFATALRGGCDTIPWEALSDSFSPAQVASLREGVVETPRIEISSTQIRRRVRENKSVRYLTPDAVADYLERHRCYAPPAT